MQIAGLQKLTLLDYPGKTAATVFTPGCNLRCPFCQNAPLVLGEPQPDGTRAIPLMDDGELWQLLERRHGLLDSVCLTGGEPLLQPDLAAACARIHAAGFSVKLDTNGTLPERLAALLADGLVEYVAVDVKNTPERYAQTVGVPGFDAAPVQRTLDLLRAGTVPYELRTTVVRELHTAADLMAMASWLADAPAWYLQEFRTGAGVIAGPDALHAWDPAELAALLPRLAARCPHVALRGTDG